MTSKAICILALPALAGCLSVSTPEISHWPIEYAGRPNTSQTAPFGVGRVAPVVVRVPYNAEGLVVLRANGTVEVDPFNEFVAPPASMLRGAVADAMEASGKFSAVVNTGSSATATTTVEVLVVRLALDCRREGERKAVADVVVRVLKAGELVAVERADGSADASSGNFGEAFSMAVSTALASAFGQFK